MRYLIFSICFFIMSCSLDDDTMRSEKWGTIALEVKVVDTSGKVSTTEETFKSRLTATLFNSNDEIIKSWDNVNQMPTQIPLPKGQYYIVVESKENAPTKQNVITHYAKTDLIQISEGEDQTVAFTFEDYLTPPSFSDFSSSSILSEDNLF